MLGLLFAIIFLNSPYYMKNLVLFLLTIASLTSFAQDSIVQLVFNAITVEAPKVEKPAKELLVNHQWEALAYWDVKTDKKLDQMFEAVGDVYTFKPDNSFELNLIDPNDGAKFGLKIKGSYIINNNSIELISSKNKKLIWTMVWLDKNYLILEIDGMRIFYTQSKSYYTFD